MKRQLLCALGMVVFGACSKPDPLCEPRKEIQSDFIHIGLGTEALILYPSGEAGTGRVPVTIESSAPVDSVRISCAEGISARMDGKDILLQGSPAMPRRSSVQLRAHCGSQRAVAEMVVERACVDVDRTLLRIPAAGAELSVGISSNLPLTFSCTGDWVTLTGTGPLEVKAAPNPGTGERNAQIWIREPQSVLDTCITLSQDGATDYGRKEREALAALYAATGGPQWKDVTSTVGGRTSSTKNWCSEKPLSEWYGVETDPEGHVIYIHLSEMGLCGTLPEELGDLVFCQELSVASNRLRGPLPVRLGEMKCLRSLSAGDNELNGVLEESTLSGLASHMKLLSLPGNEFTGGFPEWIADMPEQCNFWLQDNRLSGEVPEKVRQHPRWNAVVMDGSGRTVGEINMSQKTI